MTNRDACHVLDLLLFSPVVGPVKLSQLFLEFGVYFLIGDVLSSQSTDTHFSRLDLGLE